MTSPKYSPYPADLEGEGLSPQTSHPAYVAAVPEWFWAEDDLRAPFGSDDGNDTFRTLERYYAAGGYDSHAPRVIANLIGNWALVPEEIWESSAEDIVAWLDADENNIRFIQGEVHAFIAGACGQFKISGWIHPVLRFWAERALMLLEHVLDDWEQQNHDTEPGGYTERLAATRTVLDAAPEPPAEFLGQ